MVTKEEVLTLPNLGDGAVTEKFEIEQAKVIENIMDPNATPGKRSVVLTVTYDHDETTGISTISVDCKSKLQPPKPFVTAAAIGRGEARELCPQEPLFQGNVADIKNAKNHD